MNSEFFKEENITCFVTPISKVHDEKMHNYMCEHIHNHFLKLLLDDQNFFIARIGGSDYECVRNYFFDPKSKRYLERMINLVREFNGYFDFESSNTYGKRKNFEKYCSVLMDCYKNATHFTVGAIETINFYASKNNNVKDKYFAKEIGKNKVFMEYYFIESVYPFLKCFKEYINKSPKRQKILIISPFSESIKFQYTRKDKIIQNYEYPDFDLLTYTTPITYNNDDDASNSEKYMLKTKTWLEQCELMASEISKIDFDLALLSCASYAMYLGNHINMTMKKKAIYIGGTLNVLFNIYGGRYQSYAHTIVNMEYQIIALEKSSIENIKGSRTCASEALNAYF